jgi:hypothetical protein
LDLEIRPDLTIRIYNRHAYREKFPKGAVYVGRPSEFGNPFEMQGESDRITVCKQHRLWVLKDPSHVKRIRKKLEGRDLVCWCAPLPCHAETLAYIANAPYRIPGFHNVARRS